MTSLDTGSPEGSDGNLAGKPGGEKIRSSAAKGVTRRVIGFALVALGVLNSLFKTKAGITETSWLNLILIGAGAIIFFSALKRGRGV